MMNDGTYRLGCNLIHPTERLRDCRSQFGEAEMIRSLELIAEAGFEAAEFSHVEHLSLDELKRIGNAARNMGLECWSAHCWQAIPGSSDRVSEALSCFEDFVARMESLGAKIGVVHSGGSSNFTDEREIQARRDAHLAVLDRLAPMAEKSGIYFAIENGASYEEWEFLTGLVREFGNSTIGLNVDTGHANLSGVLPSKFIRAAGQKLITTHLQDNFGKVDDHLPPGRGMIDWIDVVAALFDVGYKGVFMIEISDCPPNREPDAPNDIRTAHDNMRAFIRTVAEA